MAQVIMAIRLEVEPVRDCLSEIIVIREALFSRHGDRFRAMQRRIEAIGDLKADDFVLHTLEPGVFVASAPPAFTALLSDARTLLAS